MDFLNKMQLDSILWKEVAIELPFKIEIWTLVRTWDSYYVINYDSSRLTGRNFFHWDGVDIAYNFYVPIKFDNWISTQRIWLQFQVKNKKKGKKTIIKF